ncbi:hypothetical protein B0A48_12480 [Cryoendolithus antarcticus]|uniref:Tyrosinase copper-binding domain-containing protein n=1 Tax=Cryoendolithus antarcticus TaxID=1507870 RepID=A0A1V8SS50_9PEZI|nr:hypothetical protein B0A48_12480 [Cryoendolithus antarcticus]
MLFFSVLASVAAIAGFAIAQSPPLSNFSSQDIASGAAWEKLQKLALERMHDNIDFRGNKCNFETATVRKEFRNMTLEHRKSFTDAVECLQRLPPQVMTHEQSAQYPGVHSRYDEYVATHINYTMTIHMTADFLAWHRFYVHSFEQDLKKHCGYTGHMPYWNWAEDAEAIDQSEIFNGDEYSMGSNGVYIPNRDHTYLGLQNVNFPPGTGGGCVHTGPFSKTKLHLGPIDSPYNNNVKSDYEDNPRCLVRDLNSFFSTQYNTYTNVTELLLGEIYVEGFQSLMQGYGSDANRFGVHGGGHWLGGGPSDLEDMHSSPNDPIFFLHHAMLDKIWLVWQYMDIWDRQFIIRGTSTMANSPPSPDMSLTDKIPFGFVAPDQTFHDLMDTFAGSFCYRYD